ncbi:hypothetical protein [Candidatus Uabimicrobium amorphum]|uniref:Uncharacterized protein n=1 Tax=Uabimicrobium amorphum TaxID=2596890 RepID=A0A5S9IJ39_UABAM|nr:hypothetical protein [Candidatus Uabimicrobium amorphum]BBM82783.1 hypothetical protein UABAM_01126 [Candidatus Uabimicrobium amorphum]
MDNRTIIWIHRFSYLGYISFAVVSALAVLGIFMLPSFRLVGAFEVALILCAVAGVWSFYHLRNENPVALLLCKVIATLLLLAHGWAFLKILRVILTPSVLSNMFQSSEAFFPIANAVSTSIFIFWAIFLMWRFFLHLDSENEEKREFAIDGQVYITAIFTALSFAMAAINHLQIDSAQAALNIRISSGGIVMLGFAGWRVLHYILLFASIVLIITATLRMEKMASMICLSVAVIFVVQTPIAMYAALTSNFVPQLAARMMLLIPLTFIFAGLVIVFYWLADSFLVIHQLKTAEIENA